MVADNLHVLLAAFISPPDHLGEVHCHEISHTSLLVRVRPASSLFTTGQLTNSENVV
jgi:hypothetical protein